MHDVMKRLIIIMVIIPLVYSAYAQRKIILDADTGNEMDDLYAISYMLAMADCELIALSSAHFNNVDLLTDSMWNGYPTRNINTVQISYDLNRELLKYTSRTDVKCLMGANKMIGRAWGGNDPRPSEASLTMIREALKMEEGEKLIVFTLGALTNVTSAIIENPEIEKKIVLYMMGANYNPENGAWNKSEFNVRNDLNAFDYLLNSDVEMHIMTATTSWAFKFDKAKTLARLRSGTKLDTVLAERWEHVNAGNNWIMWDLAMLIAYFKPAFVTEKQVLTPPENKQRSVYVYTELDPVKMEDHFWEIYSGSFQKK